MDILYISPKTKQELSQYCETELVTEVLDHFATKGTIVTKKNAAFPNRTWIITDYIKDDTLEPKRKLAVILSLAAIAGIIQINDRQEFGNVKVLCMLKELNYISETEFDYFVEAFYNFSQGNGVRFR